MDKTYLPRDPLITTECRVKYIILYGIIPTSITGFLNYTDMKHIIYFGKSLLMIVLPVVFTVVSSIIIAGLFALVGALMGHNTFVNCFQNVLGNVSFVMVIITLFMWLVYVITETL